MAELVTQSLYFQPSFDERLVNMRQYYANVIRFIDEISLILSNSFENKTQTLFMYENFFTHLKDIANNFYTLLALFSTKHYEFSNIAMDEMISLNKTVEFTTNFFNRIINSFETSKLSRNWHLGELELAANEHARIINHNLMVTDYTWQNAFLIQQMTEKMVSIVSLCSKAIRLLPCLK